MMTTLVHAQPRPVDASEGARASGADPARRGRRAGHGGRRSAVRRHRQVLREEGDYWTIVFDGTVIRLRDTKGLRYLAVLLRHPGRRLHANAVVAAAKARAPGSLERLPRTAATRSSARDPRDAERARLTVTKGIKAVLGRIAATHPALAEHLAATVRRGYICAYTPDPRYPIAWGK